MLDRDVDEIEDELSFAPSVVSSSAGRHEPRFECCGRCQGEIFNCWESAAETVEENGELTHDK